MLGKSGENIVHAPFYVAVLSGEEVFDEQNGDLTLSRLEMEIYGLDSNTIGFRGNSTIDNRVT
jgi:hypothetical protein